MTVQTACLNQVCLQALQAAGAGGQHGGRELRRHQTLGTQRLLGPRQLVADLRTGMDSSGFISSPRQPPAQEATITDATT